MEKQIEMAKEFLKAKREKVSEPNLLTLDIQYFADKGDGQGGEEDDDDEEEGDDEEDEDDQSEPSLEDLLEENPKLKKEFDALFKSRFKKRLKGVDLKEAKKALKAMKEQKQGEEDQGDDDKADEVSAKTLKLENKTKRLAVKEYAVDNSLNPKLLSRLIDLDDLELDDDGEIDPDELEEKIEELTEEFPELFRKQNKADDEEDEEEDEEDTRRNRSHKLPKRRTNKPKAGDLRESGKQKALERAKRKGLIKD